MLFVITTLFADNLLRLLNVYTSVAILVRPTGCTTGCIVYTLLNDPSRVFVDVQTCQSKRAVGGVM